MAITIQANRTTFFVSLIVDWDDEAVLPNFPEECMEGTGRRAWATCSLTIRAVPGGGHGGPEVERR